LQIFIESYSNIVAPLTNLTKKDSPFLWGREQQDAFNELNHRFTSIPILRHFDPYKPITVETDASDYVLVGILLQHNANRMLHQIAFFSAKHIPAKCNYEMYDKVPMF
jgi:hypothetical protein